MVMNEVNYSVTAILGHCRKSKHFALDLNIPRGAGYSWDPKQNVLVFHNAFK